MVLEKAKGGGLIASTLADYAVKAIHHGIDSPQWEAYMKLFAENDDQLKVLTSTELDATNKWLPHARAYIVTNAVCSAGTNTNTLNGLDRVEGDVDDVQIDNQLVSDEADANFISGRPFIIEDPF